MALASWSNRYPLALGSAIFLVQVALGVLLFATFQEWVPDELDAPDGWGGYLLAMYGTARFLFEAPTGAISDRVERRLGLLAGFALMFPSIILMALFQDARAYLVFAALLGFATAFLWPATYAISADLYPVDTRGKVIGFLNLAQLLGFGAGALVGAFLVRGPGWAQFAVAGLAVAAAFLAAVTRLPNYRHGTLFRLAPAASRPGIRSVVTPKLAQLSGIVLLTSVGLAMVVPAIRPYGTNELGVSFERLTIALIPGVVAGALIYLPAGYLADRYGRVRPFIAGEAMVVLGLVVCAAANSLAVAGFGATLVFAGNVLTVPALNAAVMDAAPESSRGTVIGLTVALSGLGLALGPALGGATVAWQGARTVFGVAAGVCTLAALSMVLYAWRHRPRALATGQ